MDIEEIRRYQIQINQIARKYGIIKVSLFGSVSRGQNTSESDIDFLVEMKEGASFLGIGGFLYEVEQLLGVSIDVIPRSILVRVSDQDFAKKVQSEAVAL